jgi:hypothetical protein
VTVVADATPLIALARIGRLTLLRELFDTVLIPEAVRDELSAKPDRPGAREILDSDYLKVVALRDRTVAEALLGELGAGEAEVIALAAETVADLALIDESRGRKVARGRGLRVAGTLAVLLRAKRRGLISVVRDEVDRLLETGFWLDDELRDAVLRAAGE